MVKIPSHFFIINYPYNIVEGRLKQRSDLNCYIELYLYGNYKKIPFKNFKANVSSLRNITYCILTCEKKFHSPALLCLHSCKPHTT